MDDTPPPAYSKDYKRLLDIAPAVSLHDPGPDNKSAQGRGSPRPLPRLPGQDTTSLKTGTVSPLRLHKKSQSTATPSVERPWKPPSDGTPTGNRWDPVANPSPPHFRHREAEFTPSPSSHEMYSRAPSPTSVPLDYGRSAGHFQSPPSRVLHPAANQTPQTPVADPNSFYNPAVSAHLSRPTPYMQPSSQTRNNNNSLNNRPPLNTNTGHVRWA
ncbi:hypothetical protein DFH07DRAFT_228323 [Mycena maculata]|uniref:Uncharacterized protein n=1 Tax=Mycena maculata TaxID=230809 RepID=A0AAD7JVI2_9AGAR|nr:hypothetical protein DFH07DRAFT_228323 [Mycena maculata]